MAFFIAVRQVLQATNASIFRHSVGRQILTKRPGADDDVGEGDAEDITIQYKSFEGTSRHQQLGTLASPLNN